MRMHIQKSINYKSIIMIQFKTKEFPRHSQAHITKPKCINNSHE